MSGIFENTLCSTPNQGDALAGANTAAAALDLTATASRLETEGFRFDGTAGATITNGGIPAVGTGDFEVALMVGPHVSTTAVYLWPVNSGGFGIYANPSGTIQAACGGIFTNAASTGTLDFNSRNIIGYRRSSGVGTYYLNGLVIGTITDTQNYYQITEQLGRLGTTYLNGTLSAARFFNYALSDAERTALIARGLTTLPEQRGGSMTALNTSNWINNGNTSFDFDTFSAASATGFTAAVNAATSAYAYMNGGATITASVGRRYLVRFTLTRTNSGVTPGFPTFNLTGNSFQTGVDRFVCVEGSNSFVATATGTSIGPAYQSNNVACDFTISNFSIIPLGTLFEQGRGQLNAGYMVRDMSGNFRDLILPASGVDIIAPGNGGTIRFTTTTNGNQQIGGSQVIIPTNARITSWVINSSGTPTVSLGNASAGTQYANAVVLVSGNNDITLSTRFAATGNLWCNSNSGATLKHTITWETFQT